MSLTLYSFFHLNLAYSAIEEEQREIVVRNCYWPLLRLAEKYPLFFGIECTAWTLEQISKIDHAWIEKLVELIEKGRCEFIGSGYAQVIGPLVPARVNKENFALGKEKYGKILGVYPEISLVNEQAYSAGLIPLYREAGYKALIMEWNNPFRSHPHWDPEWQYYPQQALAPDNSSIPVIWNQSISFQKFQRYVHKEIDLNEHLQFILSHQSASKNRLLSLYGNDVEIFDFRPGRYMTEAPLTDLNEWKRIEKLYEHLLNHPDIELIFPSRVLDSLSKEDAGNKISLESANHPIPVKKQNKYNILRWAVSGKDDLRINTACWKIYNNLVEKENFSEDEWKKLCYFWSSDFRTHISEKRWKKIVDELDAYLPALEQKKNKPDSERKASVESKDLSIIREGRFLLIKNQAFEVKFNCLRGLAIESYKDLKKSSNLIFGTLHHGYFDDISFGADFFSGHLVYESPGSHKVSDLIPVEPEIVEHDDELIIKCIIKTKNGDIKKSWHICISNFSLKLNYFIDWSEKRIGSLRFGYITLLHDSFDRNNLFITTHNGGYLEEKFKIGEEEIEYGKAVSFLVSGEQCLSLTEGIIRIGDAFKKITINIDHSESSLVAMVVNKVINDKYFTRLFFSAQEVDDTSKPISLGGYNFSLKIF